MPFVEMNTSEYIKDLSNKDPAFKKAWDDNKEEHRLIGEMIEIRKNNNMTQKSLAKLLHNRQHMISRIEKREHSPSLKSFCNILDALGYRVEIVKKTIGS